MVLVNDELYEYFGVVFVWLVNLIIEFSEELVWIVQSIINI